MLMKMTEFLKELPAKKCTSCKKEMNEQHECYTNKCTKCLKTYQKTFTIGGDRYVNQND